MEVENENEKRYPWSGFYVAHPWDLAQKGLRISQALADEICRGEAFVKDNIQGDPIIIRVKPRHKHWERKFLTKDCFGCPFFTDTSRLKRGLQNLIGLKVPPDLKGLCAYGMTDGANVYKFLLSNGNPSLPNCSITSPAIQARRDLKYQARDFFVNS